MTREEFIESKIGDKGYILRGDDSGRECEIVYKEDDILLTRTTDGNPFYSHYAGHGRFRLVNWRELKLIKEEL